MLRSSSSLRCVPESSPRERKRASTAPIRVSAAAASVIPPTRAGSSAGPTITKSFSITRRRITPCPAAMNSSSARREWLSSTSRSPRAPNDSSSPLPADTYRRRYWGCTRSYSGSSASSKPESSTVVGTPRTSVRRFPSPHAPHASAPTRNETNRVANVCCRSTGVLRCAVALRDPRAPANFTPNMSTAN